MHGLLKRLGNGNLVGIISTLVGIIVILYVRSIDEKFDHIQTIATTNEDKIYKIETMIADRRVQDEKRITTAEAQSKEIATRLANLETQVNKMLDLQVQQLLQK